MVGKLWPWHATHVAPCNLTDVLVEEFNLLHGGDKPLDPCASLTELHEAIHELRRKGQPRSALCLSGGGIRSASFALGILHGLAERKLLDKFTYLSTVSGGGYVGSWLSAWRARVGDEAVMHELAQRTAARYYKENAEVMGLRTFSSYLTPRLGLLSADTWTLVTLYLRNLLLNWLIYLPMFAAFLLIPLFAAKVLVWAHKVQGAAVPLSLLAWAGAFLLLALGVSVRGRLGGAKNGITQKDHLFLELVPTYIAGALLSIYIVMPSSAERFSWLEAAGAGAGLYGVSWLAASPSLSRPGELKASNPRKLWRGRGRNLSLWLRWVAAGGIAGLLIGWGGHLATPHGQVHSRLLVIFGVGWIAVSLFLAEALYLGLTSYWRKGDEEREWLARSSGWLAAMTVGWAAWAAISLYAEDIIVCIYSKVSSEYGAWIVGAAGAAGSGIGAAVARIGSSSSTAAGITKQVREKVPTGWLLSIASIVFLATLAIAISGGLSLLIKLTRDVVFKTASNDQDDVQNILVIGIAFSACGFFAFVVSYFVNVNRFSAHALYRNRLVRAFLGSARGQEGMASVTRDPFTGFDGSDNVWMADMCPQKGSRLFQVVNMALNVVAVSNNAWQERKAESFIVTPCRSGNEYVGFAPTRTFGSDYGGGISLGTAMAISGAAVSPNQGYHSSPLVGLVMTLFNVRLGWWLGSPSNPRTVSREGPRWGIKEIFRELFGLTNDKSPYVYLSDGGHFENLGLYEMARRRCHLIVVSDGGYDPDCAFEDLGNAVRKIWIDLGVAIKFEQIDIHKRNFPNKSLYCALGTVTYPELSSSVPQEVGYILYIKPGFHNNGKEPADVTAYALANVSFPHETTANQFFSESQMESYRSLGAHIIKTILGDGQADNMEAPTVSLRPYWTHLAKYLAPEEPKPSVKRQRSAPARSSPM